MPRCSKRNSLSLITWVPAWNGDEAGRYKDIYGQLWMGPGLVLGKDQHFIEASFDGQELFYSMSRETSSIRRPRCFPNSWSDPYVEGVLGSSIRLLTRADMAWMAGRAGLPVLDFLNALWNRPALPLPLQPQSGRWSLGTSVSALGESSP